MGTSPTAPTLEEVSAALLVCRKSLGIYPPGHPRLEASLRSLRAALTAFEETAGGPFRFEVECVLGEGDGRDTTRARRDRFELARLLQLRLVSAVTIPARAADREILELASLLHDDVFKASFNYRIDADPGSWEDIALTFYEAVELPDGSSPVIAVLERAAGIRRHDEIEPLLERLPEDVTRRLREHVSRPEFLRRVSRLRSGIRAKVATTERDAASQLDLVSESLRIALEAAEAEEGTTTPEAILRELDGFLSFAENHVDFLAGDTRSVPDGVGSDDPTDVLRALGSESKAVHTGTLVQTLKQRMGFLFRTARQPFAVPASEAPAADPHRATRRGNDAESTQTALRFPAEAKLPPIERLAPAANEVFVALELVRRPSSSLTGKWHEIERRLVTAVRAEGRVEQVTSRLVVFLAREPLRQARKLLYSFLSGYESNEALVAELDRLSEAPEANSCIDDFLGWLITTTPRRGIDVIIALRESSAEALRGVADKRLLELGGDPELLTTWLANDPDCVRTDIGRQYVLGLSAAGLRATFKHFFTHAPVSKVSSFLAHLPADLPGVEHVLLAAVDCADSLHRRIALRQLAAFPSVESVKSLSEIVKLNNLRERPDIEETKAAFVGLAGMDADAARTFLHEVFDRRKGIVKYYKRPIRQALREVLEQRDAKRCL